jgi:hypothetical protein
MWAGRVSEPLMAQKLDSVNLAHASALRGQAREVWVRRAGLVVLAAIPVLALFNVFGQAPSDSTTNSPAATLKVFVTDPGPWWPAVRGPVHDRRASGTQKTRPLFSAAAGPTA